MGVQALTGEMLFNLFVSGGKTIIDNREELNKINVFPVPDGDTGTNLSFTFTSIIENGIVYNSAGKTMKSISEEAMSGARGNSGIILAQFFFGISNAIGETQTVTVEKFSTAVKTGVSTAFDSISNPVEGTMLSLLRDWSDTLASKNQDLYDFNYLFSDSVHTAKKLLKETTNKLKDLREAHVVDAGAKGFVHFLQGAYEFIKTGVAQHPDTSSAPSEEHFHEEAVMEKELAFRYCTEALVKMYTGTGEDSKIHRVRELLSPLGDSLIVAGTDNKMRVHLHTNHPAEVFSVLKQFGPLFQQKADDMVRQREVVYKRKYSIALVTDSVCDLPQEIIDEYQIHVLPMHLIIDGNEFLDKLTITPDKFFELLDSAASYPSTSQPSSKTIANLYSFLGNYYDSIIVVHLSSKMSGTWNVSKQHADNIEDTRISVIDSKQLSGSLGLVVLRTAKEIAAGKSHDEIVPEIESFAEKADNFVSVDTLKYMVRGGRVSPLKSSIARMMNLKPIVSLDKDGNSILFGKAFSKHTNMKKINKMVLDIHRENPLHSYAVVHAHAPEAAEQHKDILTRELGKEPEYVMDISPIVALNAGLGAVSVVTMKE